MCEAAASTPATYIVTEAPETLTRALANFFEDA